jgi:serine protease AprX
VVLGVGGALLALPAPVAAQRPEISPRLAQVLARDSTAPVWLFVRPDRPLDSARALIERSGGAVRRVSHWLHAISAVLPPAAVAAARASRDLARIQPVARYRRRPAPEPPVIAPWFAVPAPPATAQDTLYGPSAMPLRRLNLFPLVDHGLTGAGVRIAVFDTGFETELPAFAQAVVVAQYDFVFNDSVVRNEANDAPTASSHGTSVWSLLAAQVPDTLIGIAPGATYLLAKTEDVRSETAVEEDNYVAALEWADSIGVDIVSSSLGYRTFDDGSGYTYAQLNGDVAVTTVAVDLAAQRGILVLTAMGNDGPAAGTLIAPADADSALGIGAEDSTGVVAGFSSRGPTADGRIKPDFTAPGVAIWLAIPQSGGGQAFGRGSGTSFATPILAGGAVLFHQAHPGYDPIAVRSAFRLAGDNRATPDNARGWGRPDLLLATTFPQGVTLISPTLPLGSITPTFAWTAPDVPTFVRPVRYRLRVGRDTTFAVTVLDTTLTDTAVVLTAPQHGGLGLFAEVTAVSADSTQARAKTGTVLRAPAWATLLTLNDPAGSTIRELRPEFRWSSPDVAAPPGPFVYDIAIVRASGGQVELEATGLTGTSFVPGVDLERNTPYRWRVTVRLGTEQEVVESSGTFVIVDDTVPTVTTLFQNFPNPFPQGATQPATCIWFDLSAEGAVTLDILDIRGVLVRSLVPGDGFGAVLPAGRYGRPAVGTTGCDSRLSWDGTATDGSTVPAGVYLAKLATPAGAFFKRIVFRGR